MLRKFKVFLSLFIAGGAYAEPAFQVQDLPKIEQPRGLLGEVGAPSLDEQRMKLARSLLSRGICQEDYYGADFCKRQAQQNTRLRAPDDMALSDRAVLGVSTE